MDVYIQSRRDGGTCQNRGLYHPACSTSQVTWNLYIFLRLAVQLPLMHVVATHPPRVGGAVVSLFRSEELQACLNRIHRKRTTSATPVVTLCQC